MHSFNIEAGRNKTRADHESEYWIRNRNLSFLNLSISRLANIFASCLLKAKEIKSK